MKKQFICADTRVSSFAQPIPAPALRRAFTLERLPKSASLSICGLGFYGLFINGKEITKGPLAPYVSNPDHYCYYDTYDVTDALQLGENVIGVLLGNGFLNPFGGFVWNFHNVPWRCSPRLSLELCISDGESTFTLEADEHFRTHASPILFDEYRFGETYDARLSLGDWASPGYDDSDWADAILCDAPRGELRRSTAEPIAVTRRIAPVSVTATDGGYLYDFGVNTAGVSQLLLRAATEGQCIRMTHGECLVDGKLSCANLTFSGFPLYETHSYTNTYIAVDGAQLYTPRFVYHGFRYVFVEGLTEQQATADALTLLEMHSALAPLGDFCCSDDTVNRLYEMARISDLANFYYFPTDCPHREKNGWTGDASMSADHMVLMYDTSASFRQWLDNIRRAQLEDGTLPGIVPTHDWGYGVGGPAWDSVLFNLPYVLCRYRGDVAVVRDNADAMVRYLEYALRRRDEHGTVAYGLGDWLPVGQPADQYDAPLYVTCSIMVIDVARKAAEMLRAIGRDEQADFAAGVAADMRSALRHRALDPETMLLEGNCQTCQAMAIYYDILDEQEKPLAFARLMELIREKDGSFDCGFLGMHTLFHVLSAFGETATAYRMITKKNYPSYAHLIETGETSLVEAFMPDGVSCGSHNHHFLGDIARWFTYVLAGLRPIDATTVEICPDPVEDLTYAEAFYRFPAGVVRVRWDREGDGIALRVEVPEGITVRYNLPKNMSVRIVE
ncbi:MAG: family 78 glycoside hydrolase catalytic domain [Clostridia bacterium]|nr:family 78 glycoside hydrolase catalytic domain [Clostridia bacterium]